MKHVLTELRTQEADLLPARLTLATFGRPVDAFLDQPNVHTDYVQAMNMAIGDGQAFASQNITLH